MKMYVIVGEGKHVVAVFSTRPQAEAFKAEYKQDCRNYVATCENNISKEEFKALDDNMKTKWWYRFGLYTNHRISIQEVEVDPTA